MKTDAYWSGYIAAEAGFERQCHDPWSAQYLIEWLDGYDAFKAEKK